MEFVFDTIGFIVQGIGYVIAGFVLLVIFAIIFGEKVHWKFEAQGYCEAYAKSKVKIKLRELAKRGQLLKIRGKLLARYQGKNVDVLLNEQTIARIEQRRNNGQGNSVETAINIEKPNKGDVLVLRIDNEEVYRERLV